MRAIFDDILVEVERHAAAAAAEPDAGEAFAHFLSEAAHMQASNQGFYDCVAQRLGAAALTPEQRTRLMSALAGPLRRAQEAGAVRQDLLPEDVTMALRMVGATTRPAPDGTPMDEHWPRYIGLISDALRPEAATPLPATAWKLR